MGAKHEMGLVNESGQGLAEYGWIIVLVAIVVVVILGVFGNTLGNIYSNIVIDELIPIFAPPP